MTLASPVGAIREQRAVHAAGKEQAAAAEEADELEEQAASEEENELASQEERWASTAPLSLEGSTSCCRSEPSHSMYHRPEITCCVQRDVQLPETRRRGTVDGCGWRR